MNAQRILFIVIAFTMVSCFGTKDYLVESDYSYSGNFKKYKTYGFIDQQRFDLDSLIPEDLIVRSIKNRMSILGYKHTDQKPNLLIGFRLYYSDFMFKGWEQPDLELWLEGKGYIDEDFDAIKYKLQEGTLMILFLDRKRSKTVWQGYNSGLIDTNSLNNERFIRGSVRTIFDEYRIFAEGFIKES
jgi:hypothetical protein